MLNHTWSDCNTLKYIKLKAYQEDYTTLTSHTTNTLDPETRGTPSDIHNTMSNPSATTGNTTRNDTIIPIIEYPHLYQYSITARLIACTIIANQHPPSPQYHTHDSKYRGNSARDRKQSPVTQIYPFPIITKILCCPWRWH